MWATRTRPKSSCARLRATLSGCARARSESQSRHGCDCRWRCLRRSAGRDSRARCCRYAERCGSGRVCWLGSPCRGDVGGPSGRAPFALSVHERMPGIESVTNATMPSNHKGRADSDEYPKDEIERLIAIYEKCDRIWVSAIRNLAQKNVEVRRLREELKQIKQEIGEILDEEDTINIGSGRPLDPNSGSGRIRELMSRNPKHVWSAAGLATELGLKRHSISSMLGNMSRRGFILRVKRGLYRARDPEDPTGCSNDSKDQNTKS